jgi:hypothetical protein
MGGAPSPEAIADAAADVVAFVVVSVEPGTNGDPPRGQVRIVEVLRGELRKEVRAASFPPPSDASWYAIRQGEDAGLARWKSQPRSGPPSHAQLIAVVYPQPDGGLAVDPRACWPDHDGRRARILWGSNAAITIIISPADDPDAFEEMTPEDRRRRGGGWTRFPVRSGRLLDTFFMFATHTDLGVFACAGELDAGDRLATCLLDKVTLVGVLPTLARLVDARADDTARALWIHGGQTGDLGRIAEALRSGTWPSNDDPAEEAAAFAHHLLQHGRAAQELDMGVCWEYRGPLRAQVSPPPTDRMRALETLYAQIRHAGMIELHVDLWEHGGAASASPQQRAAMAAELAEASRQRLAARTALEELVTRTRAEAPADVAAWALAHHAYLSLFLHDCAERGESDSVGASVATRERAEWGEVRAGARAFVDENLAYVPIDAHRYRAHFGIDPRTLERVD